MSILRVCAFIDWDTARRLVRPALERGRSARSPSFSLQVVQLKIASVLRRLALARAYRVAVRLYHGWTRGKTPTDERREWEQLALGASTDFTSGPVSFAPEIGFGDDLLCSPRRGRLYNTLRERTKGKYEQKMVDTALVADVLHFVRHDKEALALVVGDDDDLIPGVIAGENWGGKVLLLRIANEERYIDLAGILEFVEED